MATAFTTTGSVVTTVASATDQISDGDTAWLLASAALVFVMTPGLAFYYGGLVPGDNVIHTMMMSLVCIAIISVLWLIIGYSLAFGAGDGFIGYGGYAGLYNVNSTPNVVYGATVPHTAYMIFQLMFAIITPALISGSIVGRIRFKAYLLFLIAWSILVYDVVAHWVWSGWLDSNGVVHYGWLRQLGALDFAGGTVVHLISGVSGPTVAVFLGARKTKQDFVPHNIPFVLLGASLLWFGWFGFNAGSAITANGLAGSAFVNTHMAASAGFLAWMILELVFNKPSSAGAVTGGVIGLVGITPAAGCVEPWASIVIGIVTVVICFGVLQLKKKLKERGYLTFLDDSLDVFCSHAVGGAAGALLTGLFATDHINPGFNGAFYGNGKQFGIQLCAVVATCVYAVTVTSLIMLVLKVTVGIRVSEKKEIEGLDKSVHGEKAYASVRNIFGKIALRASGDIKQHKSIDENSQDANANHHIVEIGKNKTQNGNEKMAQTHSDMTPVDESVPLKQQK